MGHFYLNLIVLNNDAPMGSYSFVPPRDDIGCDTCKHRISGPSKGADYYVGVYAYNSRGYSTECGIPTPNFLSPKSAPEPPNLRSRFANKVV